MDTYKWQWFGLQTQVHSTRSSQLVTHPSTNRGLRTLIQWTHIQLALVATVNHIMT